MPMRPMWKHTKTSRHKLGKKYKELEEARAEIDDMIIRAKSHEEQKQSS